MEEAFACSGNRKGGMNGDQGNERLERTRLKRQQSDAVAGKILKEGENG